MTVPEILSFQGPFFYTLKFLPGFSIHYLYQYFNIITSSLGQNIFNSTAMNYTPNKDRYNSMTYNRCGKRGLRLPAVSLGLWHNFGGVDSFENGRAMVRRAFDLGITHFDLANNYGPPPGSAEENFGKILKKDFHALRD
jgi:hypothetical protein